MPQEIADSDGESDFSPHRPSASPIPENNVEPPPPSTLEQDPFAHFEFDQFLSPTQRLSSALERQDALPSHSTCSTDKFLLDIAQADSGTFDSTANRYGLDGSMEQANGTTAHQKIKRTMSDIEGGQSRYNRDDEIRLRATKRTKTYGSSRSQKSDVSSLFSDTVDFYQRPEAEILQGRMLPPSDTTSIGLPVQPLVDPDNIVQSASYEEVNTKHVQPRYQHGATTFIQSNLQKSSITNGSVNGYQGINMDFRGAGLSLDMSANPFGSLSQVSLDGDIDPAQSEKFAGLYHHSQQSAGDAHSVGSLDDSVGFKPSHLKEMATSPIERPSITSERPYNVQPPELKKPPPKKRGRKPKTIQPQIDQSISEIDAFQRLQSEDPLNIPLENYKPRPSRSRAGTVDSVNSYVSQAGQVTESPRRKRKRSTMPDSLEVGDNKHISSELNLSDPAMIGAPKELYVPRASKSRMKRLIEENDHEDELQVIEVPEQEAVNTTPASNENLDRPVENIQPNNVKKKTTKKSKVKRAKTSAAALLKSPEMYDEGDKDVIIVDEIPAKVKMAPLPELSLPKQEARTDSDVKEVEKGKVLDQKSLSEVKISVDIPKPANHNESESMISKPEPKKRGRKPKKKPDIKIPDEVEVDDLEGQPNTNDDIVASATTSTRSVLSDKDPNTNMQAKTTSDKDTRSSTPAPPKQTVQLTSPKKQPTSPVKPTISRSSTPSSATGPLWSKPRVGLSRRLAIPSLLRKLDRSKEGPKVIERKEKLSKKQAEAEEKRRMEAEDAGEEYQDKWEMRGKDGMLLEWDE